MRLRKLVSILLTIGMTSASTLTFNIPTVSAEPASTARYMEKLDRGLVAMKVDKSIYLTWRLLGTEAYDTTFDVYRDGTKIATIDDSTNYLDADGTVSSVYKVVPTGTSADGAKEATAFATILKYP